MRVMKKLFWPSFVRFLVVSLCQGGKRLINIASTRGRPNEKVKMTFTSDRRKRRVVHKTDISNHEIYYGINHWPV